MTVKNTSFFMTLLTVLLLTGVLTACAGSTEPPNTNPRHDDLARDRQAGPGLFTGEGGLSLFNSRSSGTDGGTGIGVNSYLWRASLDTISFMPIASADPFGGVIITDWYAPNETGDERFKVNVFILTKSLRSDGVRISVFRQTLDQENNVWRDADVDQQIAANLENAVLLRARELRTRQTADE